MRVPPEWQEGTRLAGTDDLSHLPDFDFAISPEGRYLFFNVDAMSVTVHTFVVYDIASETRRRVRIDEEAKRQMEVGRMASVDLLRWGAREDLIAFPAGAWRSGMYYLVTIPPPGAGDPRLELVHDIDHLELAPRPTFTADSLVKIEKIGHREVKIWGGLDADKVLARHRYGFPEVSDVDLHREDMTASPDADYIGYVISVDQMGFSGYSPGYVLARDGESEPRLLGSPVYGKMQWDGARRRVYAFAKDGNEVPGIYFWKY